MKLLIIFSFFVSFIFSACDFQNSTEVLDNQTSGNATINKEVTWSLIATTPYIVQYPGSNKYWVSYSEYHDENITSYKLKFVFHRVIIVGGESGTNDYVNVKITTDEPGTILNKDYNINIQEYFPTYIEIFTNTGSRNDIEITVPFGFTYFGVYVEIYRAIN